MALPYKISYFNSIKVRLKHFISDYLPKVNFNFNSIKVRLKLLLIWDFLVVYLDFNSIKVRLKQHTCISPRHRTLFQFHKGTIKTNYEKNLSIRQTNFNSIKVRLKQGINNATQTFIAFQFHKGTIKTECCRELLDNSLISIP